MDKTPLEIAIEKGNQRIELLRSGLLADNIAATLTEQDELWEVV